MSSFQTIWRTDSNKLKIRRVMNRMNLCYFASDWYILAYLKRNLANLWKRLLNNWQIEIATIMIIWPNCTQTTWDNSPELKNETFKRNECKRSVCNAVTFFDYTIPGSQEPCFLRELDLHIIGSRKQQPKPIPPPLKSFDSPKRLVRLVSSKIPTTSYQVALGGKRHFNRAWRTTTKFSIDRWKIRPPSEFVALHLLRTSTTTHEPIFEIFLGNHRVSYHYYSHLRIRLMSHAL